MPDFTEHLFAEPLWESLGKDIGIRPSEVRTVRLVCMGHGIKAIAHQYGLSPKTIEAQRLCVATKLGTAGPTELVSVLLRKAFGKYLETL